MSRRMPRRKRPGPAKAEAVNFNPWRAGMRLFLMALILIGLGGHGIAAEEDAATTSCEALTAEDDHFLVCRFDPRRDEIRLFLRDGQGEYYRHFRRLQSALEEGGETLRFAMNAGMYHDDRSPVGLYVENGERLTSA